MIFSLNQSVTAQIYPRISDAQTGDDAWNISKKEFDREEKVAMVKLQNFRRAFENLSMKSKKTIQD